MTLVKQTARDDLCLNFGGTFEDVEDTRVAKNAADLVFKRKAISTVDLKAVIGGGPSDPGAKQLGHASFKVTTTPFVFLYS